jgi:hypothetical protein
MAEAMDAAYEQLQSTGEPDVVQERIANRVIARQDLVSAIRLACWQPRSTNRSSRAWRSFFLQHSLVARACQDKPQRDAKAASSVILIK